MENNENESLEKEVSRADSQQNKPDFKNEEESDGKESQSTLKELILEASGHVGKSQNFATDSEVHAKNKKLHFSVDKTVFIVSILVFVLILVSGVIFASSALASSRISEIQKQLESQTQKVAKKTEETDSQTSSTSQTSETQKSESISACENKSSSDSPESESQNAVSSNGVVNINKASVSDLQTLSGIGPAIAARIVEYREKNGAFKTPHDLTNVKGIGDALWEKVKDKISVK